MANPISCRNTELETTRHGFSDTKTADRLEARLRAKLSGTPLQARA